MRGMSADAPGARETAVNSPDEARGLCVVIMGPKASGKSWVADVLHRCCGVHHVDPDSVILGLLAHGHGPDPVTGWLTPVEAALDQALSLHDRISTEATGAWDSDWQLLRDLASRGVIVRTIWIEAPLGLTLSRLAMRSADKVPTTPEEAAWYFSEAKQRTRHATFDLVLDGSGVLDEVSLVADVMPLLQR